jgi:hypothetical protein
MKNYSQAQLEQVVRGFIDKTLDKSLWTHHAHIITAIWHLLQFDKEDALCRLRSGIISYNISVGGENTGQNGYHETITIFWWDIIGKFLDQHPGITYGEACHKFLNSPMADKEYPFRFYTRENLLSPIARSRYVQPDLVEVLTPSY